MKLGILTDTFKHFKLYEDSCTALNVEHVTIDFLNSNWYENLIPHLDCDGFLVRPTHEFQEYNDVYMERLYFLNKVLLKPIYPSYEELKLYENKRNMASWLKIHNFPHPKTLVFIDKSEAHTYIKQCKYPIVAKSNIGAGSTGVNIIKNYKAAKKLINNIFGRIRPALTIGQPQYIKKFGMNIPTYGVAQKHTIIIQEFHDIKWEWRIIKIGNSYFGHQKLLKGQFASGSDLVGWQPPPKHLLEMVKSICDIGGFYSMAVDIFETKDDLFLINELQSLFGSYLDYQMLINKVPGRYRYINNEFVFEEGEFNKYGSYLLRVEHFIEILNEK